MAYNYNGAISTAHRLITKFGGVTQFKRGDVLRDVIAVDIEQFAKDAAGQPLNPTSKIILISCKNLTTPPDWQQDSWIDFDGNERRMTAPQTKLAPAGIAVYYEIRVAA